MFESQEVIEVVPPLAGVLGLAEERWLLLLFSEGGGRWTAAFDEANAALLKRQRGAEQPDFTGISPMRREGWPEDWIPGPMVGVHRGRQARRWPISGSTYRDTTWKTMGQA